MVTNNRPVIREATQAIWRRIKLVPFAVTIPDAEQDKTLPAKLRAEEDGVLAWMVAGCRSWQRDGLQIPAAVSDATAAYRDDQDVLGAFLADRCDLHPDANVTRDDIAAAYEDWAEKNKERYPLSRRKLYERLRLRGPTDTWIRTETHKRRGFAGIGLRTGCHT